MPLGTFGVANRVAECGVQKEKRKKLFAPSRLLARERQGDAPSVMRPTAPPSAAPVTTPMTVKVPKAGPVEPGWWDYVEVYAHCRAGERVEQHEPSLAELSKAVEQQVHGNPDDPAHAVHEDRDEREVENEHEALRPSFDERDGLIRQRHEHQ